MSVVGCQDGPTEPADGDTFHVLSLMPANKLDTFVERLRRMNTELLRQHFECWQQAYIKGELDGPPPLVGISSDEDERVARRHGAVFTRDSSSINERPAPESRKPGPAQSIKLDKAYRQPYAFFVLLTFGHRIRMTSHNEIAIRYNANRKYYARRARFGMYLPHDSIYSRRRGDRSRL